MKRLIYIFAAILTLVSCVREDLHVPDRNDVPEGYVKITFAANIMDPSMITTRAVDPDGLDVNNMTLFCFNESGLFISTQTAELVKHVAVEGVSDSGTYTATIPDNTHIIHFLANHSEGLYDESDFPGQTENMVMANMEGGSGMLVYWSRFKMDKSIAKDIAEQLAALKYVVNGVEYTGIKMIRNQAKITIDDWTTTKFVVTGFRTVNIPAFGTVAPHHQQQNFDIVENWESLDEFITLPHNRAMMSDIVDINTKSEDFIFETTNSGDNLVSVIIKGHASGKTEADDKYYRVVLQNTDGTNFMIRRNHHYNIKITGMLNYGRQTFEEALVAPPSNNAWISVDEWVNEITDGTQTLWVEKTAYVLPSDTYAGTDLILPYKYTVNSKGASAPEVTWIDNNVAYSNITNTYNTTSGEGSITLRLYPMYEGNEQQVGSLLIKHGKLQRKISIYVIKTQYFTPSWISSQVYGVSNEKVTVMFTIPETCPQALFPFTVLVSSNHLDVRSESGQELPVYIKGEEGYFGQEWDGINYKYAYTVTEPGKHRLHMESILKHNDNDSEDVHLEAEFFQTITKTVVFSGYNHTHRRIYVDDLHKYNTSYAEDEELYYLLVPQKKASPLIFTLDLQERQSNNTYKNFNHANAANAALDEFLIYTKSFSFYDDYFEDNSSVYQEMKEMAWEGEITMVNQDTWSTNGRVMAFRTRDYKTQGGAGLQTDGSYNIYMLTNSSNNTDVIRVASNKSGNPHVFAKDRNGTPYTGNYNGNEYRSVIFDVGHYRPFRFAAQAQVYDYDDKSDAVTVPASTALLSNEVHGSQEENTDNLSLSYKPGQNVDILLDITSFKGSDGRSVHPFGEIFGEEFEVYIDAPMLEIDEKRIPENWKAANNPDLTVDKLRKDPTVPGRFIYTVSRKRADEKAFGFAEAHNKDLATSRYDDYGGVVPHNEISQEGERKCLPFTKTSITSKGNIVISSNKDKVVFWDKTFKVKTVHMTGTLKYRKNGQDLNIPHDAFVAFVRMYTGARIGVVTLGQNGQFDLNLRDEYRFDWEDDPIDFYYTDKTDGKVYNFNYTVDGVSKTVDLNVLYTLLKEGKPIVLTEQE